MKRRVVLLGNPRKRGVREAVSRARGWISESADVVAVDLDETLDLSTVEADLAVIFGGDGSILSVAHRMGSRPIPTIGVNFGKFGFLTDIRADEVREVLGEVLAGRFEVEHRLMLWGRLSGPKIVTREHLALNEFFVGPSTVGRMVSIDLLLDGEHATTYRGDGLLVSTPTGSTGHSLSAGGPIVDPELEAILLTPVSPHSLTNRPLVVPPGASVELRPQPDHRRRSATFSIDGQFTTTLRAGDALEVTRAPFRFPLVRSGLRTRWEVLRNRLGWSGQPPYQREGVDPS